MKDYKDLIKKAKNEIEISDHLLYKTFSLIKDIKFLISITEHIIIASELALDALLEYEKYWKRIGAFPESFSFKINIFEKKIISRYKLDLKYLKLLKLLLELKIYIRESPIRFKKQDKYILSTEDYKMMTLDIDKVKRYLNIVKNFIKDVDKIILNNENEKFRRNRKETTIR